MKSKQEWKKITLGELVTFQRGHDLPKNQRKIGNYPLVSSSGIIDFHNEYKAKGPGVVIGRSGSLGSSHYIEKDYWPLNTTLYSKQFHNCNPKFVYYFIKTLDLQNYNAGTSVPTLNRNHIHPIEISVPSTIDEQEKISKPLSDLDTKIQNLQYQNKILEQIAQVIFKSWFVDFDGVTEFEDSELGQIPKEWNTDVIKNIFRLEYGWHLPAWKRKSGDVPVYGSGGLTGFHNKSLINGPGIIVGRAGKIGKDSIYYSYRNFCPIETTFYVKTQNEILIPYIYYFLKGLQTIDTGSSIPNLSRSIVHNLKMIIPEINILRSFDSITQKLFLKIAVTNSQIDILIKIRDALLPKLMSGEIRV